MSLETDDANTTESAKPFTEGGKCSDEVQLIFDDQQKLFVSQNFLMLASPVFEAMFKNDFKEKQTMTVNMEGKSYDDVLEFLLCINPGVKNTITTSNVLRVAPLAEEYHVSGIIAICKSCMKTKLNTEIQTVKGTALTACVLQVRNCLKILEVLSLFNDEDYIAHAAKLIAIFGHRIYYGKYGPEIFEKDLRIRINSGSGETVRDIIKECRELFGNLPAKVKCEVLSHRLAYYQDDETKK